MRGSPTTTAERHTEELQTEVQICLVLPRLQRGQGDDDAKADAEHNEASCDDKADEEDNEASHKTSHNGTTNDNDEKTDEDAKAEASKACSGIRF